MLHAREDSARMTRWRFFDYCSGAGNDLIEDWYQDLPEDAQADFDTTLKVLSATEDWRGLKEFKMLRRCGLGEIRFRTANVQYRVAGFFGPGARTFSLFAGCQKKQKVYDPPDSFGLAMERRKRLNRGIGRLRERLI